MMFFLNKDKLMTPLKPLDPSTLRQRCDPNQFAFETTADLPVLEEIIGQPRALAAVRFGVRIRREGYNLFAMGPNGVGKQTAVTQFLTQQAEQSTTPADWCYVYNFARPHQPQVLELPPGQAVGLRQAMDQLIEDLSATIPAVFDSDEYQSRRRLIEEKFNEQREKSWTSLQQQAKARELMLLPTQTGLAVAPAKDGQAMPPEQFQQLPEPEQRRIETDIVQLQVQLHDVYQDLVQFERDIRHQLEALKREVAQSATEPYVAELRRKYEALPAVVAYLMAVQQDIVDHIDDFGRQEDADSSEPLKRMVSSPGQMGNTPFPRYRINVLVDHDPTAGAPIIYEDHPTYSNLIGRVENVVGPMGSLIADFSLIKAGALHRANGGYLILDAYKLLSQPNAWDQLKRILRAGEIRIESLNQVFGLVSTISLEPEPIPLTVKVVLVGERTLYYMLHQGDPDFAELFKVVVDFEEAMDRSPVNQQLYARLIATLVRKENLRHLDPTGVARVLEYSARKVEDAEKLSVHMQGIADLLREADYWTAEAGLSVIGEAEIDRAIEAMIYRSDRVRNRLQEAIQRGTILIDTQGAVVGQVNGLSVMMLGNFPFGQPNRITARVRLGRGELIDIEREVELGGPLHSKGVLILSGFLGSRYVPDTPLSLSASLVFEQSYNGVDGDSASSAELYALLSALAEVPLKQSLAVTGSVNQRGQVQAIGGVNDKIEGFFDLCQARGLTGEQGVLIPAANVQHLMLRQDVVDAVAAGQFHVYPVETIDQGLSLLTGLPAGERDESGQFPAESVNGRVEARLIALAEAGRDFDSTVADQNESSPA
jgi:predicted ATP-dependent protease